MKYWSNATYQSDIIHQFNEKSHTKKKNVDSVLKPKIKPHGFTIT